MRQFAKVIVWLVGISVVAIAAMLVVAWQFSDRMCANEMITEVRAPDGKHKVVVFQRDCGATTGFSTQLSLLRSGGALDNDPGNIFVADTNHGAAPAGLRDGPSVNVTWIDSDSLEVKFHPKARIFVANKQAIGKQIFYRATDHEAQ
jgi:hypothetical protein